MKLFDNIPFIQNLFKTKNTAFYKHTPSFYKASLKGNRAYLFEAGIKDLDDAVAKLKM